MNSHFVEMVILAAPMHDLGKIAIPDSILKKPGPLTREEFEIMKTHASKGGQMVAQILKGVTNEDYTRIAFEVANYHHEKWDGSGYPKQLAGEDIPLSARIMALADVYDALTMEGVYKKPFPKEVALSIIKEGIGTQFDPLLGPIFVKLMEEETAKGEEAPSMSAGTEGRRDAHAGGVPRPLHVCWDGRAAKEKKEKMVAEKDCLCIPPVSPAFVNGCIPGIGDRCVGQVRCRSRKGSFQLDGLPFG